MRIDADLLARKFSETCPSAAELLGDASQSLRDYARRVYTPGPAPVNGLSEQAGNILRRRMAAALAERAEWRGVDLDQAWAAPVLQTGPHYRPALDDDYFPTLAFSLLGSTAARNKLNVMFNCATVTLEERPRRGPGWLNLRSEPVRMFDLGRRALAKKSVIAFNEPVRASAEFIKTVESLVNTTGIPIDTKAVAEFAGSPQHHISAFNEQIFEALRSAYGVTTLVLDERFFARVLVDTLNCGDSLLSRLFDDGRVMTAIRLLRSLDHVAEARFIPNSTDLFWLNIDGKVRQLRLEDGHLVSHRHNVRIPLEKAQIIAALEAGLILPGLFLVFCMASLVPMIRAIGGAYQVVYYESFLQVVRSLLDRTRADERLLASELANSSLAAWGHNVIADAISNIDTVDVDGLPQLRFSSALERMSVMSASNELSSFACDELWADFCASPPLELSAQTLSLATVG